MVTETSQKPDVGDVTGNETTTQPETETENNAASLSDMVGEVIAGFDPATHATDKDGSPILTASGTFRKKPGRKPGAGQSVTAPVSKQKEKLTAKAQQLSSEELARALVNFAVGGAVSLIGEEWDFTSPEEAQGMKLAVAGYIEAKGNGNLSPEMLLLLVIGGYSLDRMKHQNTRTKLGKFFGGVFGTLKSGIRALFKR